MITTTVEGIASLVHTFHIREDGKTHSHIKAATKATTKAARRNPGKIVLARNRATGKVDVAAKKEIRRFKPDRTTTIIRRKGRRPMVKVRYFANQLYKFHVREDGKRHNHLSTGQKIGVWSGGMLGGAAINSTLKSLHRRKNKQDPERRAKLARIKKRQGPAGR